jgi:hypothetical protein
MPFLPSGNIMEVNGVCSRISVVNQSSFLMRVKYAPVLEAWPFSSHERIMGLSSSRVALVVAFGMLDLLPLKKYLEQAVAQYLDPLGHSIGIRTRRPSPNCAEKFIFLFVALPVFRVESSAFQQG